MEDVHDGYRKALPVGVVEDFVNLEQDLSVRALYITFEARIRLLTLVQDRRKILRRTTYILAA